MWVESDGDNYLLAHLSKQHPQHTTNLVFSDQEIKLYVKGKGEVHLTGSFQIENMYDDSDEMGDSDLMGEHPSSSSDEEGAAGFPAHVGAKRIEMLDEDSSSSSEAPVQAKPQKKQKTAVAPPAAQPAKPANPNQGGSKKGSNNKKNNKGSNNNKGGSNKGSNKKH